jgi:hypothetical protein
MTSANGYPTILTFSGGFYFDLENPDPQRVLINDIAQGLSNTCRFAGQCREFYSVAQHSVHVSEIVPPEDALAALLHDAQEAYIHDITRPLKQLLPDYRDIEKVLERVIAERFALPWPLPASIKGADLIMLATEQRDLMPPHEDTWYCLRGITPRAAPLYPWTPQQARTEFLCRFYQLGGT